MSRRNLSRAFIIVATAGVLGSGEVNAQTNKLCFDFYEDVHNRAAHYPLYPTSIVQGGLHVGFSSPYNIDDGGIFFYDDANPAELGRTAIDVSVLMLVTVVSFEVRFSRPLDAVFPDPLVLATALITGLDRTGAATDVTVSIDFDHTGAQFVRVVGEGVTTLRIASADALFAAVGQPFSFGVQGVCAEVA